MSQYLRYKSEEERIAFIADNKDIFVDGIGDLFFALCRLSNQLGVDVELAFNTVKSGISTKYSQKYKESKEAKTNHASAPYSL